MNQTVNCLRCRRASLLPETDMSKRGTLIHCGHAGGPRPILLLPCPIADPRHGSTSTGNTAQSGGDRTRFASPVEIAFLRAHYARASWPQLIKALGRSEASIVGTARRAGLSRDPTGDKARLRLAAQIARSKRAETGLTFTPEQAAYIHACYNRGFWVRYGHNLSEKGQARAARIRAEIVETVHALDPNGKEWPWITIRRHIYRTSPAVRRGDKKRRERARQVFTEIG